MNKVHCDACDEVIEGERTPSATVELLGGSRMAIVVEAVPGHREDVHVCLYCALKVLNEQDTRDRAARVSYDADWRAGEDQGSDARLIRYLWRNQHTSPFEAVALTFEVKAPLFVLRQWHRHRTWSYNEVSARYTELDEGFYVPEPEAITTPATDNKQGRTEERHPQSVWIHDLLKEHVHDANQLYRRLLAAGCPRELARLVLPVSAYSRMFATVNLLNLFRFLALRLHAHAQREMQAYARALLGLAQPVAPVAVAAFAEKERLALAGAAARGTP